VHLDTTLMLHNHGSWMPISIIKLPPRQPVRSTPQIASISLDKGTFQAITDIFAYTSLSWLRYNSRPAAQLRQSSASVFQLSKATGYSDFYPDNPPSIVTGKTFSVTIEGNEFQTFWGLSRDGTVNDPADLCSRPVAHLTRSQMQIRMSKWAPRQVVSGFITL
jgi:hypothetical protein